MLEMKRTHRSAVRRFSADQQKRQRRNCLPLGLASWLQKFETWSTSDKTRAVDLLLSKCDSHQIRHVASIIEPQFQLDFLAELPKNLALLILGFLDAKDIARAAQVSSSWHSLAEDHILWREKCFENGITEPYFVPEGSTFYGCPWKAAYIRQYDIAKNWRDLSTDTAMILRGHDDHVITCLQFNGTKIVSGSDDNTLRVWCLVTGKCLETLQGHSGGVWSCEVAGDTAVSGSTDRTLRVWNISNGECLFTLHGHTSTVRCIALYGDRVVSGSRDTTLRMWDVTTGQLCVVLEGHCAAVRCVCFDGSSVVSGSYDHTVRVWNPSTGSCLFVLNGHSHRVYSLQFDGVYAVSGSLDTSIMVWDVAKGRLKHTLMGHRSLTSSMVLRGRTLVSGNADSTVRVWDVELGECVHTLQGSGRHQSAVTGLQLCGRDLVVSASDDGSVKLWSLKTGEFIRNLTSLDSAGHGGVVWRIQCTDTKLICAVGSRNGTEETKLMIVDFESTRFNPSTS